MPAPSMEITGHLHLAADHRLVAPTPNQQLAEACIHDNQTLALTLLLQAARQEWEERQNSKYADNGDQQDEGRHIHSNDNSQEPTFTSASSDQSDNNARGDDRYGSPHVPLDIDKPDAEGTPCLVYAACWNHTHIAALLLAAGASVDVTDSNGWTPLMWAAANNHVDMQELLLAHGADSTRKTKQNRTLHEIVRSSSSMSMYNNAPVPSSSSPTPQSTSTLGKFSSAAASSADFFGISVSGALSMIASPASAASTAFFPSILPIREERETDRDDEEEEWEWDDATAYSSQQLHTHNTSRNSVSSFDLENQLNAGRRGHNDYDDDDDDDFVQRTPFHWESCKLDQILIFEERNISRILRVAICELRPTKLSLGKPIPANIIFLCSRYAHYLSSLELLEEFLGESLTAIQREIRARVESVHTLTFWISNCTHLLYFFQKDPSLCLATFKYQRIFAELVHELYDLLVTNIRSQLLEILDVAVLDYMDPESITPVVSSPTSPKPRRVGETSGSSNAALQLKRASWVLYKQTNDLFSAAVRTAAATISTLSSNHTYQRQQYLSEVRRVVHSGSENASLVDRHTHIYPAKITHDTSSPSNRPVRRGAPSFPLSPHSGTRRRAPLTPRRVTQILQNSLQSLRLARVHVDIRRQVMRQVLTSLNAAIVDGLLRGPKGRAVNGRAGGTVGSRAWALNVRMNMSVVETWIRVNERDMWTNDSDPPLSEDADCGLGDIGSPKFFEAADGATAVDGSHDSETETNGDPTVSQDGDDSDNLAADGGDYGDLDEAESSVHEDSKTLPAAIAALSPAPSLTPLSLPPREHELTQAFQLARLMHVVTAIDSLESYLEISKSLDRLTATHVRRMLDSYVRTGSERGGFPGDEDDNDADDSHVLDDADADDDAHAAAAAADAAGGNVVCDDIDMYVRHMAEAETLQSEGTRGSGARERAVSASAAISEARLGQVFPFRVPMFEEGGVVEWKDARRPYVPAVVLRMIDGDEADGDDDDHDLMMVDV
ncbi:hypothetical protein HDU83_007062 [Entophlyctis luteolus]|nr:hypothetical protein HDU83_007062 [Entophlyctis luteolus]